GGFRQAPEQLLHGVEAAVPGVAAGGYGTLVELRARALELVPEARQPGAEVRVVEVLAHERVALAAARQQVARRQAAGLLVVGDDRGQARELVVDEHDRYAALAQGAEDLVADVAAHHQQAVHAPLAGQVEEVFAALEAAEHQVLVGLLQHLLDAADDLHVEGVEDDWRVARHHGHADVVGGAALEAQRHGGAAVAERGGRLEHAPPRGLGDLGSVVERAGGRGDAHPRLGGDI